MTEKNEKSKTKNLVQEMLDRLDSLPPGPDRIGRFLGADETVVCPHCGRTVPKRWSYCIGGCGGRLRRAAAVITDKTKSTAFVNRSLGSLDR